MNTMSVTEFKAKCLEMLDRIGSRDIDTLTITKRGKVLAVISAPRTREDEIRNLHGFMRGSVILPGGFDLTAPVLDESLDAEDGLLHR